MNPGRAFLLATTLLVQAPHPREVLSTDRLTPERMEKLVQGPVVLVRQQGLAAGAANFERLLETTRRLKGPDSVEVADLIMSFGVALFDEGLETDDMSLFDASAIYLEASVGRYRAAFGDRHPQVAVALHSWAGALLFNAAQRARTGPIGDPDPRALAALEEAVQIRSAALGPQHPETRSVKRELLEARHGPRPVDRR